MADDYLVAQVLENETKLCETFERLRQADITIASLKEQIRVLQLRIDLITQRHDRLWPASELTLRAPTEEGSYYDVLLCDDSN